MISVEEALARISEAMPLMTSETVALPDGLGRTLAEDLTARRTQPPFDASAMDGYAVRHEDLNIPAELNLIGEAPAGAAFQGLVGQGQAVRIFTGGPVPTGADTVVIQENTERDGDRVRILEGTYKGRNIRKAGVDFEAGQMLLKTGTLLTPRHLALAAAMNIPWLQVRRRPRVALLATGDELVQPGETANPSQIISSNSHGLAAFVTAWGGEPINLGIAPDDADSLTRMAEGAQGADLFVTLGGASVGDHDLVQKVLGKGGLDVDFWKIAMRPGKPLIFGHFKDCPMIGLPGNPVSAMVCALLYVKPSLSAMLGRSSEAGATHLRSACLTQALPQNGQRQDYMRGKVSRDETGDAFVTPYSAQDSSLLSVLAEADCLIVRAPEAPAVDEGERVTIVPFITE